jgi:hypothetical protein
MVDFVGTVSTYHPNFDVIAERGYTMVNRGGRWIARLDASGEAEILAGNIEILASNDVIRVADKKHGRMHVRRICVFAWGCSDAEKLRLLSFTYVAVWY